jgi:hypothetical protein
MKTHQRARQGDCEAFALTTPDFRHKSMPGESFEFSRRWNDDRTHYGPRSAGPDKFITAKLSGSFDSVELLWKIFWR